MDPQVRYEIIDTIAQGDFATVYKARDKELGREVAIKQIHQQYLADPQKLEKFWQEAQLLANLEHPSIMMIYDIVRERGWLVLELMQGSLQQQLAGNPIDLEDMRLTLKYILHGLNFLHQNGIVHGDIKPGNLLLDKNHRVKLGDFGIARRITGDDGSVVKGTTKYIAPEVLSDQFGPVGPHSDLYSLGFSAYELLCGNHFDTLFPSLNMYGRDQQIAWIMWHSAMDQRLPEMDRVLQGVPEDLAQVIQRLIEKDPTKRFQTAQQVLTQMDLGLEGADELSEEEKAVAEKEEKQAKRKRLMTIGALCVSMLMSLGMLFGEQLFGPKKDEQQVVETQHPDAGIITNVFLDDNLLQVTPTVGGENFGVKFQAGQDRILLNGAEAKLSDLKRGDRIKIDHLTRGDIKFQEIVVTRQLATAISSQITAIDARAAKVTLAAKGGDGTPLVIYVPSDIELQLNGAETHNGQPVRLATLKADDRVQIEYMVDNDRPVAVSLSALRLMSATGKLVSINTDQRTVSLRRTGFERAAPQSFTVAPECEFVLNGVSVLSEGRAVTLADLKSEDRAVITHDAVATRIEVQRQFSHAGIIAGVDVASRVISVKLAGQQNPVNFALSADCRIKLGGANMPLDLPFLMPGDQVQIDHTSATLTNPEAHSIAVALATDPSRWAIVIGQQEYDDAKVTKLANPAGDAQLVRDALRNLYRVPSDNILYKENISRLRLQRDLPEFLKRVQQARQLIVYYVGHAYIDEDNNALLAPVEFELGRMTETGVPLKWLVNQLEEVAVPEKLLLLDTCHLGGGEDLKAQPSSADLAATLIDGPTRPVSTSVTVVTSCREMERGLVTGDGRGLFAQAIATAYSGQADLDSNHYVESGELFTFLSSSVPQLAGSAGAMQRPFQYLPDAKPARLSNETKAAVKLLLGHVAAARLGTGFAEQYTAAKQLQPKQPDADLAWALANLAHNRTRDAQDKFELIRASHPKRLLPNQALAWQYFMQKNYSKGIDSLQQFMEQLSKPAPGEDYDAYAKHVFAFAGELAAYAFAAAERPVSGQQIQALTNAVQKHGDAAFASYSNAVTSVREKFAQQKEKFDGEPDSDEKEKLKRDLHRLTFYTKFNETVAAGYIRSRLEE